MSNDSLPPVPKPDHVPNELVCDFDLFDVPNSADDVQIAIRAFQQSAPDIFWTPRNGGHWVATRADDIDVLQRDFTRFSNDQYLVPKKPSGMERELPLEVDPPRHTALRRPLTMALMPSVVKENEERIRDLAVTLIEAFRERGSCDFVSEFAQVFPIGIFLDFAHLPREDRHLLLPITKKVVHGRNPEVRQAGQQELLSYIVPIVQARRANPGDDIISALINVEENGERISEGDAIAYATFVLFGGLDTVVAMLSLVARFLARNPGHRRELIDNLYDEKFMRGAIEELLRRHGLATTARMITQDFDFKGAPLRKGEMILVLNLLTGMDERRNEDPLTVDFHRLPGNTHAVFGNGPHTCPGAVLARRELKIFLQEWLSRIPEFGIEPGTVAASHTGFVSGLRELRLSWPTSGGSVDGPVQSGARLDA
jgi:cytochrome P450